VAAAIATPPIVGVGLSCHRSARGGTTAPTAGAARRTAPPNATPALVASTNAMSRIKKK
jgi:hypothetical protein